MATTIEASDPVDYVELTKRMMCIYEHGVDEYGQIVLYTNCQEFDQKVFDADGKMCGMAFGIREIEWEEIG